VPTLSFVLNGRETTVEYDDGMRLLAVLREVCGITTPKDGCAPEGVCGCCTVLLDGKPALSCQLEAHKASGRAVVTLEGLPERQRQLLADAFAREGAVQCGFCTPGIVVRASRLLEKGLTGNRSRVEKALAGHLCRCTGYNRIVDAIQTAGEAWQNGVEVGDGPPRRADFFGEAYGLQRSSEVPDSDGVGASIPRYRGREQTLGAKEFVEDLEVENMLHAALVLSEHPRARVIRIDPRPALEMPGVRRVLTADDVPGVRRHGLIVHDWPLLVSEGETTRYIGDVLAVVVADSQHRAREAAGRVEIEYEVLDPVCSPHEALAPNAPAIHKGGNLLEACAFARGDTEAALGNSAHVIEETFTTQRIEHAFLEPEASLAVPDNGRLRVFSQGQGVHDDQRQIAAILALDVAQVDVELVSNGGAFGGKEDLSIQGHTALAAWLLQQPVKTVLTREQSIRMHPKRHPLTLHYTAGCDSEGRLTAVRARIIGDTGAYASVGAKVLERAAGHACGPYRVANVDVEARTVYTNNPPCGAMRGFGANQASFAIEGVLDRMAEKVGIDGYDIRERNVLDPGDRFATGQLMNSSCGIRQTLEAVRGLYKSAQGAVGIGCGIKNTGIGNGMADIGRVAIEVLDSGRLVLETGFTEMGQGLHTILRQVVHHESGVDPEIMDVRTVSLPEVECGMTTASRATALCTAAGRNAATQLAEALSSARLDELAGRRFTGEYICDFTTAPGAPVEEPVTHMAFGYATQVVMLDEEGRLLKVVAAHDVGRAINPQSCAGQIEGGVHMGLGYALSEDFPCVEGRPVHGGLRDLGILRAAHTPEIDVILIEVPDGVGGYGSKGVGEIGLVPTAGAVAAALRAHDGIWRNALPMSDAPAAQPSLPRSR
jgi:xanthine dehydrogenase molybdenum-binding subunit